MHQMNYAPDMVMLEHGMLRHKDLSEDLYGDGRMIKGKADDLCS